MESKFVEINDRFFNLNAILWTEVVYEVPDRYAATPTANKSLLVIYQVEANNRGIGVTLEGWEMEQMITALRNA